MNVWESIGLAINSIIVNKLRALLTLMSIVIGVFTIIVASGLITSINSTVDEQLADLGENVYSIYRMPKIQMGRDEWRKYRKRKPINYSIYKDFKKRISSTGIVSASSESGGKLVEYKNNESNPDVSVIGADEDYFLTNIVDIDKGRAFSRDDIDFNRNVAIIGMDIVKLLFPFEEALGKEIKIKNQVFTVIGTLEEQGAIFGQSQDNKVVVPITQFLKYYSEWWEESLTINVKAPSPEMLIPSIEEAIGILRSLRNDQPWEGNSFEIETNETLSEQFSSLTGYLAFFGNAIGIIALIAAGVGIMNIMLVTVKERTREIGVRKAVGAKRRWILLQFLIETVTLCQIGGLMGIAAGLGAMSLLGSVLGLSISLPVNGIILSIVFCTVMGIGFGMYPAWQASKIDPIDALRYE